MAELNRVATKIRQLVATGQYRYRDFLVVTRHLDGYQTMLEPIFSRHQIPVFNDNQRPMATSPLATFTAALFKVLKDYYQEADVMELLKTGLLVPETPEELQQEGRAKRNPNTFMTAVYRTENYCLKFGKGGGRGLTSGRGDWKENNQKAMRSSAKTPRLTGSKITSKTNWPRPWPTYKRPLPGGS